MAILCGLITSIPNLRKGPVHTPDERRYAAYVETVRGGNQWMYSEIYVWEHRNDSWIVPRLPVWILGIGARLLGSTQAVFTVVDLLLPPLVFLMLYGMLLRLDLRASTAILGATAYVLHYSDLGDVLPVVARHGVFRTVWWHLVPFLIGDSTFKEMSITRVPYPLISSIFLLFGGLLVHTALRRKQARWTVAAGCAAGLIFYIRVYEWTTVFASLALAGAGLWIGGRRAHARILAGIFVVGMIVGSPNVLLVLSARGSPAYEAVLSHQYGTATRALFPDWLHEYYPSGHLCLLASLMVCALLYRRHRAAEVGFYVSLALGVALSQQVVTGLSVQPHHWLVYFVYPNAVLILALMMGGAINRIRSEGLRKAGLATVVGLTAVHGAILQEYLSRSSKMQELAGSEFREAVQAARRGPVSEPVILCWPANDLRAADAHVWGFLASSVGFCTVPTAELYERLFLACRLLGVEEEAMAEAFRRGFPPGTWDTVADGSQIGLKPIEFPSLRQGGLTHIRMPPEDYERWMQFYRGLETKLDPLIVRIRLKYRLDFVLVTPEMKALIDDSELHRRSGFEEVFRGPTLTLYRIR